jgi:two-component system, cell cycle sensor histidine kinase and response regulator CckA
MTERERVEAALRESEKRASFLADATRILASSLDYEKTLRNVAQLAVPELADWCGVDLLEDGAIRRVAVEHSDPSKVEMVRRIAERYPPDLEASVGVAKVIRTGQSEFGPDIPDSLLESAARDEEHLRLLRGLGLRSYVVSPLLTQGRVLGAITFVFAESGRAYRAEDLAFVEDLAGRAATAIENARLVREISEARRQAEELALELESQAAELQEQSAEMEVLNDELVTAETRLRGIIDSALDAIVATDAESIITLWSRHAETIFGWTAEEAIGRSLAETIIPPQHREAHRRGMERYLATGEGPILNRRIEITALHRDGREFPVELTVAPAREGSRTLFSAFIRDITERKEAERRLSAEHAVTRVLAESHTLETATPRILEAIGGQLGWAVGAFWRVDAAEGVLRVAGTWAAAGLPAAAFLERTLRTSFARGEGLPGRVWQSGEPAWIADVATDAAFPRAPEAASAGLHGAFCFPVRVGADCLGVIEFFHTEVLAADERLITAAEAMGGDIGQSVRRVQAEEERDRALAAAERANLELAERTAEAESANRAKSEFLANMSHEFRTPINAIVGYADLLTMEIAGPLTAKQQDQLNRIRASSNHLLGLVEDVLDLAKIEAGRLTVEIERTPAAIPVTAALELIAPQADERGIEIRNECPRDPDTCFEGDTDRVRQILANLLSNAVKFTDSGGRITVSCQVPSAPDPAAALSPDTRWMCLSVEDTGIGMEPDQLDAVFGAFVQGESGRTRTRGGTGLGLTISRRLASLMGGTLTVTSEPGVGSRFTLWLPAAPSCDEVEEVA